MTLSAFPDPIRGIDVPRLQPTSEARCPSCRHGAYAGAPAQRASHLPVSHDVGECDLHLDELDTEAADRASAAEMFDELAAASPERIGQPWGSVDLRPATEAEVALLAAHRHEVDRRIPVRVDVVDGHRSRTFTLRDGSEVAW